MKKVKTVLLLTGGMDSSTMLLFLSKNNFDVYPLYVDFGQPASKEEWESIQAISKFYGTDKVKRLVVKDVGKMRITESDGFVYHRNAFLLTLAAMYAASQKINIVSAGFIVTTPRYVDCNVKFFGVMEKMLQTSMNSKKIKLFTPFIGLEKSEVALYGFVNGMRYDLTYSCFTGKKVPCGKCNGCGTRVKALKAIGLKDARYS